jgi:hypothetical protein
VISAISISAASIRVVGFLFGITKTDGILRCAPRDSRERSQAKGCGIMRWVRIGKAECEGIVTKCDILTGTMMGGVINCKTDVTKEFLCFLEPQAFRLIAHNLRAGLHMNPHKPELNYDDAHRVAKYLKGRKVRIRWNVLVREDMTMYAPRIIGVVE